MKSKSIKQSGWFYDKLLDCSLYHGTTSEKADAIARFNFDLRSVKRGFGIYFAQFAGYACYYHDTPRFDCKELRYMIIADVLMVGVLETSLSIFEPIAYLPEPFDTISYTDKSLFLKLNPNEILPRYKVTYTVTKNDATRKRKTEDDHIESVVKGMGLVIELKVKVPFHNI